MVAPNPRVLVISSVSGGGKTTLVRELLRLHPDLHVAITATSRPPRGDELDGRDYFFLSNEEFRRRVESGDFLEHAHVHGNLYGIPAGPVQAMLDQGRSVVLNIDFQGMRTVRRALGNQVSTFFLLPPDTATWEERLRNRKTDSEESIRGRLEQGRAELKTAAEFDYKIVNDDLDRATAEFSAILHQLGAVAGK
ncbi:MAG: guanylate kinase [Leptospirales bacterium]|nr:guanylate kinase [Leptospirales bacterium]